MHQKIVGTLAVLCGLVAVVLSSLSMLGHLIGNPALYRWSGEAMAPNTCISLLFLGCGAVLTGAYSGWGSSSTETSRRLDALVDRLLADTTLHKERMLNDERLCRDRQDAGHSSGIQHRPADDARRPDAGVGQVAQQVPEQHQQRGGQDR